MCSDGAFCLESHYSAGKGLQFSDKLQVNIKSLKTSGSEPDVSDVNLSWVFFLTVSDKEVPAEHRQKEEGGRGAQHLHQSSNQLSSSVWPTGGVAEKLLGLNLCRWRLNTYLHQDGLAELLTIDDLYGHFLTRYTVDAKLDQSWRQRGDAQTTIRCSMNTRTPSSHAVRWSTIRCSMNTDIRRNMWDSKGSCRQNAQTRRIS